MGSPAATLKALQGLEEARRRRTAGDMRGAAAAFSEALRLLPGHPVILREFGELASAGGDHENALRLFTQLLAVRPGDIDALRLRSGALLHLRRWDALLADARQIYAQSQDRHATDLLLFALFQLGRRAELDARVPDALARFGDNLLVVSTCAMHLAKCHDGARGFAWPHAVRARWKPGSSVGVADAPVNFWDGQPFDGLLVVVATQGIGDEILAAGLFRDLVALRERCGQDVRVQCDARLMPLFRRAFPSLDFVDRADAASDPATLAGGRGWRWIKALDLAHHFRRQSPLAPQSPWLVADAARVEALRTDYRARHAGRRTGGLAWKSSRVDTGPGKSMALADLAPLLTDTRSAWYSLQYGDIGADLADLAARGIPPPHIDARIDATNDLDGLAAQITALGLVVTTSNSTAHIAGALGIECHLLLPRESPVLWYWGYEGSSTPWYPTIRIHRNPRDDGWTDCVAALAATPGERA